MKAGTTFKDEAFALPTAANLGDDAHLARALRPGTVIAGKYRIEHLIGAGAMGFVVAARHLALDEIVAIKLIRPDMQEVPGVVTRFAREAKACVRIKSDHIANVLDVGIAPSLGPYIVMEYLEGQDLGQVLEEAKVLKSRRACDYVMQACEALALAHSMGIIHRDVKPSNLFLTRRGDLENIKVLDFGISKVALTGHVFGGDLSLSDTAYMIGTPLYMSPEQIRSTREIDHRSDVWSLGVVLRELVTGETAFVAESLTEVCAMVLESAPAAWKPSDDVPLGLRAVIDRCLEKDPGRRFQNVGELATALVPFAPSRARLHADRANSVLRPRSDDTQTGVHESGLYPKSDPPGSSSARGPGQVPSLEQLGRSVPLTSAATKISSVEPGVTLSAAPFPESRSRWRWAALALPALGAVLLAGMATRQCAGTSDETPLGAAAHADATLRRATEHDAVAHATTAQDSSPRTNVPAAARELPPPAASASLASRAAGSQSPASRPVNRKSTTDPARSSRRSARGERAAVAVSESRVAPEPARPEAKTAKARARLLDDARVRLLE